MRKTMISIMSLCVAAVVAGGLTGPNSLDHSQAHPTDTITPTDDTPGFLPREVRDTAHLHALDSLNASGDYSTRIHLIARSYGDSIVLRWAAEDYVSWNYLNHVGVDIYRFAVIDNPDKVTEDDLNVDTLAYRLKPATLEEWRALYSTTDSVASIAMGTLYGEGGFTQDQSSHGVGEMGALLDVHDDQQFRFAMAVLASEWRPDVAERLAMRFVDRTAKKGKRYEYVVRPSVFDSTGNLDFRAGHIEDIENKKYKPEPFTIVMGDSVIGVNNIRIWWQQTPRFSSFDIHRRAMGESTWTKVNTRPYLMMRDVNEQDLDNFISDNVPGPGTYEYRISGYDAFGDYVTAENYHVCTMPDLQAPRPAVLKRIIIDRRDPNNLSKDVFATFHFAKDTFETDFIGYKILYYERSRDEGKAKWVELTPNLISTSDTTCTVEVTGMGSSQVAVAAYDSAKNVSYSMTHVIRITDVKAPEAPENFKAEILDNAEGTVKLTWTAPSEDIDYYELAFANDTTHEFMLRQIPGDSLLRDTMFIDTLAVDVNQKYIYYKVRAIDYATNEGAYTPILQVIRPSMVKPAVAHIDSAWVDQKKGVRMRWVCSNEQQVSHHILMRRLAKTKNWTIIGVYDADSVRAAGNMVDVTDVPEYNREQFYEYAMESFSYAGISSGLSLVYSERFEGELIFDWPIKLYGDYDPKKRETKLAWEVSTPLPYKGDWYFCIFRKGPSDKRAQHLLSAAPTDRSFNDYLLKKGESAEYYILIQYADGRSSRPSNTITITAPAAEQE